jgi:uncharacterized protein (DUF486 family)
MDDRLKTTLLLFASNTFMTVAWYGHLKWKEHAPRLPVIIAVSWGIALFEYILQVPANRIGYRVMSAYQLKIIQEGCSLIVFMIFAGLWLGEGVQIRYLVSFGLVMLAVVVAFK